MFDREEEFRVLEEAYNSGKAELVIIYGRRRIGKTTLVKEFLDKFGGVYLFTPRGDIEDILSSYSEDFSRELGEFVRFRDFRDFLEFLRFRSDRERFLVAIDEFQRIYRSYKPAISLIQHYWDSYLRNSKIFLILVGSVVGMVERIALVGDAPLYGRRTRELKVGALSYVRARKYWASYSEEERVEAYGFFGGTPGYFTLTSDSLSPIENVEHLVLSPGAPLSREPEELLAEETRASWTYMSILSRIARGGRGLPLSKIKVGKGSPTVYLRTLRLMDIVDVLESLAQGDRIYFILDEFFRFWFKFIYPRQTLLEMNRGELIRERILEDKNEYLSVTFEKILRELILVSSGREINGFEVPSVDKIGGFWWRDIEVDACGIGREAVIVGEAKWWDKKVDWRDVREFVLKKGFIEKKVGKRVIGIMISKEGYTSRATRYENDELLLLDLNDLAKFFDKLYA